MSPVAVELQRPAEGFPRVSGDEPQSMTEPTADLMVFPA